MRTIATAAATALIATATIAATPQPASAGQPSPLVRGTVTNAHGAKVSGAKVFVFAEPASSEKLKTGQSMTVKPIGTATTDTKGRYTVTPAASTDLRRYADSSGQLNLDVLVQTGTTAYASLVQRDFSRTASSRSPISPARADLELTSATKVHTRRTAGADAPQGAVPRTIVMTVKVVKDYGSRSTTVGTWYSDMKNVQQTFTYGRSAKSALGVALSLTGRAGTFKANGTKSQSTTKTAGFGTQKGKGGWRFNTTFHYQKRHYKWCSGWTCNESYKIEPMSWRGGATVSKGPAYSASYCVRMKAGGFWIEDDTKAWTFASGVNNAGMTVVDLSSQTGFSQAAKQKITFGSAGRLCGKSDWPAGTPKALRAKPL